MDPILFSQLLLCYYGSHLFSLQSHPTLPLIGYLLRFGCLDVGRRGGGLVRIIVKMSEYTNHRESTANEGQSGPFLQRKAVGYWTDVLKHQ